MLLQAMPPTGGYVQTQSAYANKNPSVIAEGFLLSMHEALSYDTLWAILLSMACNIMPSLWPAHASWKSHVER